jgi:hypothetical protein
MMRMRKRNTIAVIGYTGVYKATFNYRSLQ